MNQAIKSAPELADRMIAVPAFEGMPTKVAQYWLVPEERAKAKQLLEAA